MNTKSLSSPLTAPPKNPNVGNGGQGPTSPASSDSQLKADRVILGNLPSARRMTGEQAEQRSRTVRRLRLILPVIAVLLVGVFLLLGQSSEEDSAFLDDLKVDEIVAEEALVINPQFSGIDSAGKPYQITANTAAQNPDKDDLVNLEGPKAVLTDDYAETVATAKTGFFRSGQKILDLKENVIFERIINGKSYTLRSEAAVVGIEEQTLKSSEGVSGETLDGKLRADEMEVFNQDGRVILKGNVRMKFEPDLINNETNEFPNGQESSLIKSAPSPQTSDPIAANKTSQN